MPVWFVSNHVTLTRVQDFLFSLSIAKNRGALLEKTGTKFCTVGPSNAVGLGNLYCGSQ